jgi:hypothetical protein
MERLVGNTNFVELLGSEKKKWLREFLVCVFPRMRHCFTDNLHALTGGECEVCQCSHKPPDASEPAIFVVVSYRFTAVSIVVVFVALYRFTAVSIVVVVVALYRFTAVSTVCGAVRILVVIVKQ